MNILAFLMPLAEKFFEAEQELYADPKQISTFESAIVEASNQSAARFMSMVFADMNERLCESSKRKEDFNIQRTDERSLITTVGDVRFPHTMFCDKKANRCRYLLDEMIGLPKSERFSPLAESKLLYEAEVHSYQHAADSLTVGEQTIRKTTVMRKIHGILEDLPEELPLPEEEKKQCEYLYIEADEDHIARQKDDPEKDGIIGKLVYLFEGKEEAIQSL